MLSKNHPYASFSTYLTPSAPQRRSACPALPKGKSHKLLVFRLNRDKSYSVRFKGAETVFMLFPSECGSISFSEKGCGSSSGLSQSAHFHPAPPPNRSMPLFVPPAIFHAPTQDEFLPKSPHCLTLCPCEPQRQRGENRAGARRRVRNTSLEFLWLLGGEKVTVTTVTLNRLLEHIGMMNM